MPRAHRYGVAGAAYPLTHRCHDRAFLLRFAGDRQRYRMLLRQELAERPVSLLSYCITSKPTHVLLKVEARARGKHCRGGAEAGGGEGVRWRVRSRVGPGKRL